ncbi:RNA-directed DNA polymerase [Bacillus sp. IITD106]|nr:RNA-directed DNA polymerase [Bacillus sp. IITD106]
MTRDHQQVVEEFKYKGFFSEYLPKNFNLESDKIDLFNLDFSEKSDFIEPLKFTMSRFTNDEQRRMIYLPELTNYLILLKYMAENNIISELINFSQENDNSFSKILHSNGSISKHEVNYNFTSAADDNDEVLKSTFIQNIVEKINRAKGSKGILYIDIANFYGSIYTHVFPAILLGFETSLEQYKFYNANNQDERIKEEYRKYLKLDEKVRLLNGGRTNGLLTGPNVSFVLAEALLTRIDRELNEQGIKFVRYMDDYEIFIFDENSIDKVKSQVTRVLSKYYLSLNNEKTEYRKYPYFKFKNLEKIYQSFTENELESADIIELFNKFFEIEEDGSKGAVKYLVKTIDDGFQTQDFQLFSSFLINVLANDNRSLIKVCELLIREKEHLDINSDFIALIERLIKQYAIAHKDLEVIWLLFLLKNLDINEIHFDTVCKVVESENELAIIIILEEFNSSLTEQIKEKIIEFSNSWILLYQLYLKEYITVEQFKEKSRIKSNFRFYNKLKYKRFSFYKCI